MSLPDLPLPTPGQRHWAEPLNESLEALNEALGTIPTTEELDDAVTAAETARDQAQTYAANTQELQDAAVAGLITDPASATRAALVAARIPNVEAAKNSRIIESVDLIDVRGYYEEGDAGAARYRRVYTEPPHAGKLKTADGAWWEIAETTFNIEMFGGRPVPADVHDVSVVMAEYDSTEAFNNMSFTARSLDRGVSINAGHWAHSATLNWYDGVSYVGEVRGDTWRAANVSTGTSWPNSKYGNLSGAVFIAYGTFERTYTLDYVSSNRQNGYGRNIPTEYRPFDNGLDSRIDLWDGTNQDAVGAARATLKPFSVAHFFNNTDLRRFDIRDVAFISNCPDPSQTFGLAGYGYHNSVVPWADVDFGVFSPSPFHGRFTFQAIGYWNERGVLLTGERYGIENQGYAENNLFEKCVIQGGLAIRMRDSWPILSKTANTITVRWTASHRFSETGVLRIGSQLYSSTMASYAYSSLSYNPGNQTLTFTIPDGTANISVGGAGGYHIFMAAGAGFANTTFRDCEFFDFSHSSRVDDMSPDLGDRARAYSAAVEISGYVRAVHFQSSVLRPLGPVMLLFGMLADVTFSDMWMEGRSNRRRFVTDTTAHGYGTVAIAGPERSMLAEVGNAGTGDVVFNATRNIHSSVNRKPIRGYDSVGYTFGMDDVVTLYWRDLGEESGVAPIASNNLRLWAQPTAGLDLRGRNSAGTATYAMRTFPDSGSVAIGHRSDGTYTLLSSGPTLTPLISATATIAPGSGYNPDLGTASNRWGTVYATNGTINTSDEREKQDIRELSEIERQIATEIKGLIRTYRWKESAAVKGDGARIHVGVVAQQVRDVFERHGLDPHDYALFCYDEWDEESELVTEDGEVERPYRAAGNRYGIRYDELIAFIISAL